MNTHRITNFESLATTPLRRDALTIVEAAYDAIDTRSVVARNCKLVGSILSIREHVYDLAAFEHVYVIGVGKASCVAISALEDVLQDRIFAGVAIDKTPQVCKTVAVYTGAHPIPTEENVTASCKVAELAEQATDKDLVIVVVSGGGSSLLCWPVTEYEQEKIMYDDFLTTGGTIEELNTVRKHISGVKGGGLAKLLYPATVVGLIFSDVPGDQYQFVASGPTYKDTTTIADAEAILAKYHIPNTFTFNETPKEDIYFERVTNVPLVSNIIAVAGMKEKAQELGYAVVVQSTAEYREASLVLKDMKAALAPKTAVIVAGEPSVVVTKVDTSGRNEYAAAQALSHVEAGQVCIPFASDGIDNKSVAAGALVDMDALNDARARQVPIEQHMTDHTIDALWSEIGTQIITGTTGSNVSDCILYLQQ